MDYVYTALLVFGSIFLLILAIPLLIVPILEYLEKNSSFWFNLLNPKGVKIKELETLVGTYKFTPYYQNLLAKNNLPPSSGRNIIKNLKKEIYHSNDARNFPVNYRLNFLIESKVNSNKQFFESVNKQMRHELAKKQEEEKKKSKQRIRNVSLSTRTKVLERDNYTCQMCGRNFKEDGVKLEVDHIMPVAKGGSDNISNLQTLCFDCNRGKSDKILNSQQK